MNTRLELKEIKGEIQLAKFFSHGFLVPHIKLFNARKKVKFYST